MILTFKYRVKDRSQRKWLRGMAFRTNQVWNACVAFHRSCVNFWPSRFEFANCLLDVRREFGVQSDTYDEVIRGFTTSRDTHKRCPRFRVSNQGRANRSLGWIPFKGRQIRIERGRFRLAGRWLHFWMHRDLPGRVLTGALVEEATGKWFVVFTVEAPDMKPAPEGTNVGIDLGLKALATLSDGTVVEGPKALRKWEKKLAIAQHAGNRRRVRAIHAKIRNIRRHHAHVESARIASRYRNVFVGDVNASRLARTRMAKSVLDNAWGMFKAFLAYKVRRHRGKFEVVDERYTSQTCSSCGALPPERPKGIAGLGIRRWKCSACGVEHDRDLNAALNILRVGLERQPLAGESP